MENTWLLIIIALAVIGLALILLALRGASKPSVDTESAAPPAAMLDEAEPAPIIPQPAFETTGESEAALAEALTPEGPLSATPPPPVETPPQPAPAETPTAPTAPPAETPTPQEAPAPEPAPQEIPAPQPDVIETPSAPAGSGAGAADDLRQLKGVGPKLVGILTGLGVTRFEQIAAWSEADIAAIDAQLGTFAGRIQRDEWVEQATLLAAGDRAAYEAKFGNLGAKA